MVSARHAINLGISLVLSLIISFIISQFVDGYAIASNLIEIVPCENIQSEEYTGLCYETKSTARAGLSAIKIVLGFITPFVIIYGFLRRIGLK